MTALEQAKLSFWRRSAIILALAVVAGLIGGRDADDAEFTAKEVAAAQARKEVRPEQILPLLSPLYCDATMRVSAGYIVDKTGCYVRGIDR